MKTVIPAKAGIPGIQGAGSSADASRVMISSIPAQPRNDELEIQLPHRI